MKNAEKRTMGIVLEELNAKVNAFNDSTVAEERNKLSIEFKTLTDEYNQLALLSAYASFLNTDNPVVELAKAYYYTTVSVTRKIANKVDTDGAIESKETASVHEKNTKFDIAKFIEWSEDHNKSVASNKNWKVQTYKARRLIVDQWKKFFASKGENTTMSVGKTKQALQEMFDSIVFVAGESGKNAVIASGKIARFALGFANNRKDVKVEDVVNITGYIMPDATWKVMLLDILHMAVAGKDYELVYGNPEEDVDANVDADEVDA